MSPTPSRRTTPRDTILYKTFDLFRSSSEVSCPTCGQHFRSSEGSKRSEVMRGEITSLFRDYVPERHGDLFVGGNAYEACREFLEQIGAYARFTLGGDAKADFIVSRLKMHLMGLEDDDREESRGERGPGRHGDRSRGAHRRGRQGEG